MALAFLSILQYYACKMKNEPKGPIAARLRQRKHQLLRSLELPPEALPGTLTLSLTRCGKPNCRCATGEGHPRWVLTYMLDKKRRVETIPAEWVEEIEARVKAGRAFKDAVDEILSANARLLLLWRKQRR